MPRFVLLISLLCGIAGVIGAQPGTPGSHLRPLHREAVERWLSGRKLALRIATLADCTNKEGLAITREERGKAYHPYYVVGDFNGDRKEDFAVALVDPRKRKLRFAVAIFNGPVAGQSPPAYFEANW